MSYLSNPASTTEFGLVTVGANINVLDGLISIEQSVAPNADITFANANITGNLLAGGNLVVTSVVPSVGLGLALSNVNTGGTTATFSITNTGVLQLIAGSGISISSGTGNVTISATGADLIAVYGTTTSYTATANDEYIGVSSATAVTITLPSGIPGRVYTIKDEFGQGSGKITIQPQIGELVDGKAKYVISIPYQSVSVVFRSTGWWII
jgi:hypothetical protein